jgi:hypothetical protein
MAARNGIPEQLRILHGHQKVLNQLILNIQLIMELIGLQSKRNVPSSGFYTWTQVPNTASNNCKVRIGGAGTGVPFDESNGTFSILPEPDIKIIAPNGGETLQTGTSNNITWTSENIANVKIELTTNNGASWTI